MASPEAAPPRATGVNWPRFSAALGLAVALLGVLVLVGWTADIPALKNILSHRVTMKPNTAICFALCGAALWARRPQPRLSLVGALLALALAAATHLEYILEINPGFDTAFFADDMQPFTTIFPGRMSPNVATCFVMASLALLLLRRQAPLQVSAQWLALAVGLVAHVALVGYCFGAAPSWDIAFFTGMSFPTAVGFFLLALGIFCAETGHGVAAIVAAPLTGGWMARRLLLAAVAVPTAVGWLLFVGINREFFSSAFGFALQITASVVLLVLLIGATARDANRDDLRRSALEDERMRLLARVRQQAAELEQRVAERTAELRTAHEQARAHAFAAERANAAKGEFLALVSHEIRTPMNAVIATAQDLEATATTADQREAAVAIRMSGEALFEMVGELLDWAKIEAGRLELDLAEMSPAQCVEAALQLHRAAAGRKRLTLAAHLDPAVPAIVIGDATRVRQILGNLVSNAIKFTAHGRVAVSLNVERPGAADQATLVYRVRDTGIGLTTAQRARLFQPFVQADPSTARQYGGTGLGLAISRRLGELMGGELTVTSEPGAGAEFTFRCPAKVVLEADHVKA